MDAPPIQYTVGGDGTRIAFASWGSGPAVVYVPMPYPQLGGLDDDFASERVLRTVVMRGLSQGRRGVMYDGRGTGLSRRDDQRERAPRRNRDLTLWRLVPA